MKGGSFANKKRQHAGVFLYRGISDNRLN